MLFPLHDDNPVSRTPVVTYGLVLANLGIYFWLWLLPLPRQDLTVLQRGFVPARLTHLNDPRPIRVPGHPRVWLAPMQPKQVLLSLLTCMFLHGSWGHVIGNMWFLWIFGNNVEDRLGAVLFLLFYLGGGVAATAAHWFLDPNSVVPVVGASGAVAAILGAYAITWPRARVHTLLFLVLIWFVDLPAILVLGGWFVMQIVLAMSGQGAVAWWAHIGGFLAGMLAMPGVCGLIDPRPARRRIERDEDL